MSIPDFQSTMLPLLKFVHERGTVRVADAADELADRMGLSTNDQTELLTSGHQTRWGSRINWAATHLFQAGLLTRPERGHIRLSDEGVLVVQQPPDKINVKFLNRYPTYLDFRSRTKAKVTESALVEGMEPSGSPVDLLESTYQQFRAVLAEEILAQSKQITPSFFERMVVQLLVAMGYGGSFRDAAQAIGKTGDGGIDGIIKEDRLGLDFVAVQAKRWEHSVGREVVQAFAGSLMGHGASKGVLITTSTFTSSAKEYAAKLSSNKIVLIDGDQLAELMLDFGIGVTDVTTFRIQRVDHDYFEAT